MHISAHIASVPSLETRWLLRHYKGICEPKVAFVENLGSCSGYYVHPAKAECLIGDIYIPADNGIIALSLSCIETEEEVRGVIAHELRHHLQFLAGIEHDSVSWADTVAGADYGAWAAGVNRYFWSSWCEMDALRFELRIAPSWASIHTAETIGILK